MGRKTRTCVICYAKDKPFFANFPRDVKRCKTWIKYIGNEDLIYLPTEKLQEVRHVCGDHFKKEDFNEKGNRLKKNAVPTLNLKLTPLADELLAEFPFHIGCQKVTNSVTSTSKEALTAVEVSNDPTPVPSISKGALTAVVSNDPTPMPSIRKGALTAIVVSNDPTPVPSISKRALTAVVVSNDPTHVPSISKGALTVVVVSNDPTHVPSISKGALTVVVVSNDPTPVPSTSKGLMYIPKISNKDVVEKPNHTICLKRKLDYCETVTDLNKKMKNIKHHYRKELKKIPAPRSGDAGYVNQPSSFLRDEMLSNVTEGNLSITEISSQISNDSIEIEDISEENSQENITACDEEASIYPQQAFTSSQEASISSQEVSTPLREAYTSQRAKKMKTANDIRTEFLELERKSIELLETDLSNQSRNEASRLDNKSDDYYFFMSLLPQMEKFTPIQKFRVRQKINQTILNELSVNESMDPSNE